MAFTQVEVTGVVQLQNATAASGAVVSFLLSQEISDGSTAVYPQALTTRCASDGSFSITVNALDDDTTNPQGAYYTVKITYGAQQIGSLQVVVSAADAPTVDLYSLLAPSGTPASGVTQLQAGDGISLDPGSGLGVVTITATGGTQAYGTLATTNDTEQTVTISEGGDYEPVTWGSAGTADGVTLDADAGTITVGTTGSYLFVLDLIVKSTGTGKELAMSFCVNGEQVLEVVGAYALSGVAQAHFSGNFTGAFNEGDVVSVQVTTTDAASTLVVTDGQFSAFG